MARFLSEKWFDEVEAAAVPAAGDADVILEQVVTGTPAGDVRYQVVVAAGRAVVTRGRAGSPDATFTEDYATATAISKGECTPEAALLAGHIVVAGNMATLSARQGDMAGLDSIPPAVRATTTF